MKIIIVTGFLGAGKTTVLLKLAEHIAKKHPEAKTPLAIIENEIGEISVDDATLSGAGGGYEVKSLFSGCVCCTLIGEMTTSIQKLADELDPLYAIIEPTGVADPASIAESISQFLDFETRIVSIVDAERWGIIKQALKMIIPRQLSNADVLLVNKVDKVDDAVLEGVDADIREHNTDAPLYHVCANQSIDAEILDQMCGEEA